MNIQRAMDKGPWKRILKKMDPYPNLVHYSPGVLKKKTKVLDINTEKTCIIKVNVESSPQEIWIYKDPFSWKKNGSPSLDLAKHIMYTIILYKDIVTPSALSKPTTIYTMI